MNENYTKASLRERILLNQWIQDTSYLSLIEMTKPDGFDPYDAIITDNEKVYIVETKVRMYPLSAYTTWFIEYDKYISLLKEAKKRHLVPLYVNFHSDGIQIFNLSEGNEPIWTDILLQENSQEANPNLKLKGTGLLESKNAIIINKPQQITLATHKANQLFDKYFKK